MRRRGSSPLARGTPANPSLPAMPDRFIPARAGNTPGPSRPPRPGPVHPRSRGEHATTRSDERAPSGSSPLARGTQPPQIRVAFGPRFIPARAGNTVPPRPGIRTPSVHPRSRGEHVLVGIVLDLAGGSSPLARGTRSARPEHRFPGRFIPARAGNTAGPTWFPNHSPVHPRSRGEHLQFSASGGDVAGSSPLARGTPRVGPGLFVDHRFIPARAGNTRDRARRRHGWSVHPRSRGEHPARSMRRSTVSGSSPLARGTPRQDGPRGNCPRFIPARAGNTAGPRPRPASPPVHPRSRGEHAAAAARLYRNHGSSPLARGTPCPRSQPARSRRFIPARAGNTALRSSASFCASVHPRSRGEHGVRPRQAPVARRFIPARAGNTSGKAEQARYYPVHPRSRGEHITGPEADRLNDGSSPLARGTRTPPHPTGSQRRFIPARAGNTVGVSISALAGAVHPRSRGEHCGSDEPASARHGSSPLARGTRLRKVLPTPAVRFIPARAGNTTWPASRPVRWTVHPRSRGEHQGELPDLLTVRGSSPLARGTRGVPGGPEHHRRFIPARAGNTHRHLLTG